jgi:hypothetical protein
VGAADATDGTPSAWTWEDGTNFDWNNWGPEEPNNGRTTCDGTAADCGENCAVMSARLSEWTDHAESGGGNDGKAGRDDYQWNDGGCGSLMQSVCGSPSSSGSRSLLAYYSFDLGDAADSSGNHRDGAVEGGVTFVDHGVSGKAATPSRLRPPGTVPGGPRTIHSINPYENISLSQSGPDNIPGRR